MKRKKLGTLFFCFVLVVTIIITNGVFIKAVKKQIERIEVTYLLGEWVDCSQPLDKNFISIQIYYTDGSMIQKQGVGIIYPYILTPGVLSKIQVEYEGVMGEFFVWGKNKPDSDLEDISKESPKSSTIPIVTATGTSIELPASVIPSKTPAPPTALVSNACYELVSSKKEIVLTKKTVKKYNIYGNQNFTFTLGTNNIKKIEYQFVKKGKKKSNRWRTMKNNQVVLSKQGCYVLYLQFTTMKGKKIVRHTNGFVLDKSTPVIQGVKNKKTYHKKVTVSYEDSLSGIGEATINGEKLKKNTTIKKNGTYNVEVTDKAKNKKSLKFTVSIPTPTPKPSPTVQPISTPVSEPEQAPYIAVTGITAASSLSVEKGKTKRISYQVNPSNATNPKVTFTSTNKKIVTVSTDGTIRGMASGVASIVIRSQSDSTKYATCVVYVK